MNLIIPLRVKRFVLPMDNHSEDERIEGCFHDDSSLVLKIGKDPIILLIPSSVWLVGCLKNAAIFKLCEISVCLEEVDSYPRVVCMLYLSE